MCFCRSRPASEARAIGLVAVALAASLFAAAPARADTLYDALGGGDGLTCIVDRLFVLNLADPRIRDKFDNINIPRLKSRILDDFCTLASGPCHFKGISMKGAHAGLHIRQYHFNALVENLEVAMDECHVGFRTQSRLLAILAPMERDIVEP